MDIGETEIREVVRSIWESVLGWDAEPTAPLEINRGSHAFRTGFIQIAGAWEGAIVCIASEEMLRSAAALIFETPSDDVTIEMVHDALGELTNMVGGNLKALLPGPSFLCLPAVIEGADYAVCVPSAQSIAESGFVCNEQPFSVKLLASAPRRPSSRALHADGFVSA
jgi:chemotaxis protein CheX